MGNDKTKDTAEVLPGVGEYEQYRQELKILIGVIMGAKPEEVAQVEERLRRMQAQYHEFIGRARDPLWAGGKIDSKGLEHPPVWVPSGGSLDLPAGKGWKAQHRLLLTKGLRIFCQEIGIEERRGERLEGMSVTVDFQGNEVRLREARGVLLAGTGEVASSGEGKFEWKDGTIVDLLGGVSIDRTGLLLRVRTTALNTVTVYR